MKNNKKKIWKIIGATFGVATICCIIPACVVSCGSSSLSSNSSTNSSSQPQTISSSLLQLSANCNNKNVNLVPESVETIMDDINLPQSGSALKIEADSMVVYQTPEINNSYTITVNNPPQNEGSLTYQWYSINMSEISQEYQNGATDQNISTSANVDFVGNYVKLGGTPIKNSNNASYTFSSANKGGGSVFICVVTTATTKYYSQAIWFESATSTLKNNNDSTPVSNSQVGGNDPLHLQTTSCSITLDNKNLKPISSSNNRLMYLPILN